MEVIRRLCSFEGRRAGTDAERRAANYLADTLRQAGRPADVEPVYVHPQYARVHAVHCLLGIAGSLVSLEIPPLGFALVLAAALSMYLDLNTRLYLVRRLFFRRASQNALSGVVPGANDNASGVATALSLAAELDRDRPEHLDVWVLLAGGGWSLHEGVRSFVRAHRDRLSPDSTYFVFLDTVGAGHVRFEVATGWVVSFPLDRRLIEMCEALADADREGEDRPAALERAHAFALALVRLIDRDVGRRRAVV